MDDGGGGGERRNSSPLPLPLQPFFRFRSNFRTITRLETLATQASLKGMSEKACDCKVDNIWMCVDINFPNPICTVSFFDTALTRKTSSYENILIVKLLLNFPYFCLGLMH